MSELNAESVLASIVELRESIVESRKETAELRKSIAEQGERSDKATAELRKSLAEQGERSDKATAELRESIAEQGRRMDEQGRRIDKLVEEFAETRADFAKTRAEFAETRAELKGNTRAIGNLTNRLGSLVEKLVLPGIVGKFNEKGFKFDTVSANVEFLNEKKNGKLAELDALLENGKFVIAVETKTELTVKDVDTYIKRLQALRKVPRFKGKKIYGAFSTAIAEPKSINYALGKGFYVLQQPDTISIRILDFPKGNSAKAW